MGKFFDGPGFVRRERGFPYMIIPYCPACRQPVDRFTIDPVTSDYRMSIEARCCDRTSGAYVSREDAMAAAHNIRKVWLSPKQLPRHRGLVTAAKAISKGTKNAGSETGTAT